MAAIVRRMARDRRVWLVLGVVALVIALRASGLGEVLSFDTLRRHRALLTGWVAAYPALAALGFVAVYVTAVALSLPGAVFLTLTGGFLFGAVLGTGLTVAAATAGATLIFLTARAIFGEAALERFGPRAQAMVAGLRRNAWSYMLVLRLVPLFPFFLVNLVPAFAGVRLPVFVVTTLVGIAPGTAVISSAGAGLGSVLDAGGEVDLRAILTPEILIALCGLAALSLLAIPLKNRFAAKKGEG